MPPAPEHPARPAAAGFAPWTPPPGLLATRLETPRTILRPFAPDDAQALYRTIADIRESLLPWLPWARTAHPDPEWTLWWILEQRRLAREGNLDMFVLGVFDRAGGAVVGGSGISRVRPELRAGETGYWVRPDRRGEGLCTEFTARVISWALAAPEGGGLGLRRVEIFCSAENAASARIPEKLGLRPEVHARLDHFVPGRGATDRLGWGVLAEEWDAQRHARRNACRVP